MLIAIDFDGVIVEHIDIHERGIFGEPLPGVRKALQSLVRMGHKIMIHTSRDEVKDIKAYLLKYDIPFHYVNDNPESTFYNNGTKPPASLYIDDKALTFNGVWDDNFIQKIVNFQPWHKKDNNKEQLIDDLLDLSNYCSLTYGLITGKNEAGFAEAQARSKAIHEEKTKTHGSGFFSAGLENAYNDIRRKFLRIKHAMGKGENE